MSEKVRLRLPLLLDGATGTEYKKAGLPDDVCVEQWACAHPEVLQEVAVCYAQAGSDIVYAPTFLANAEQLKRFGLQAQTSALNSQLITLTKQAVCEKNCLVAGTLTTTGLTCEPFGETEFTHLIDLYAQQVQAIAASGADLLVIETMRSLSECRAAVIAAKRSGLPILLTMTVDQHGNTAWGDDLLASMVVLQDMGIFAFGLNCSEGPEPMIPVFERLAPYAKIPLIAKPNVGNPPLSPIQFADKCAQLMRRKVQILGGCCGTDPEYIKALRHMMDGFDIDQVQIKPAEYAILAASAQGVYYLDEDLEYSSPILCEVDMADTLLDVTHEVCDAVLVHLDTPDDAYQFSRNAHMIDMPVAFESESLEALEHALIHYNGKALLASTNCEIERAELEVLACQYGAVVL